jgi:RimJ/RimL family protein N-acetyltransferase
MPDQPEPLRGLRGERVYLRPLEPEDADLVATWYADERVRWLMGDPPISRARRRQRYEEAVTGDGDAVVRFVICRLDDDVPIGRADLFDIDRANGKCGFGIALGDPTSWGGGLGTDAVDAIVDFAFGELRMERVWLDTDAHNERAQAAYRKAGFVVEGRFRNAWYQYGEFSDDIRMAMLREEWLALSRPRSWDRAAEAALGPDGDGVDWPRPGQAGSTPPS